MTNKSIQHIASNTQISFPYVYGENVQCVYPDVHMSIERITPEIAEKMLHTNVNNRDPKREAIAKAIRNAQWKLNGATIVFDNNGILLDGQNRLMACIKADMPIVTVVVRGIGKNAQITMDTGVKRALADYLKLNGYKNVSIVGAAGLMIYRADTYGLQSAFTMPTIGKDTMETVFEFIQSEYDSRIKPLVGSCKQIGKAYGVKSGTSGVLLDAFSKAGDENLNEFIQQLLNKKPACTSIRLLQDKLRKDKESKYGRLPQKVIAAIIIKTWNAYMLGDDIKSLRFVQGGAHPESFPKVFIDYE